MRILEVVPSRRALLLTVDLPYCFVWCQQSPFAQTIKRVFTTLRVIPRSCGCSISALPLQLYNNQYIIGSIIALFADNSACRPLLASYDDNLASVWFYNRAVLLLTCRVGKVSWLCYWPGVPKSCRNMNCSSKTISESTLSWLCRSHWHFPSVLPGMVESGRSQNSLYWFGDWCPIDTK